MSIGNKRSSASRSIPRVGTSAIDGQWKQKPVNPQMPLDGIVQNKPVATQVQQRRSVVDSEYVPRAHIILHSSGDMWKADYYRQLVGLDDALKPLQEDVAPSEQPYELIKGLELRVDDPLSTSQDQESKEFEVTGSGAVTHGIIPNQGDMFVADIGDGKAGLLTVTSSEKAAYTKDAAYIIQWQVVSELSSETLTSLTDKVVRTLVYVRELAEMYDTPFMTESAYGTYVGLVYKDDQLVENFKAMFWSRDTRSIRVPGTPCTLYDGFHAEFCREIGLSDINHPIQTYRIALLDNDDVVSLWNMFGDMDIFRLPMLHREFCTYSANCNREMHIGRSIAWSPFDYAIVPEGDVEDADGVVEFTASALTLDPLGSPTAVKVLPVVLQERFNLSAKPLFGVVKFSPYVFSNSFYDMASDQETILELMTTMMLKGEYVPPEIVAVLADELFTEPRLNIYYYTPIVLVLIHYCKRGGE